ncbi:MAG: HD-GYP domain-containing protein [Actinomycetota bacterium]|nr:response regulator [Actinomycetota bacterium]
MIPTVRVLVVDDTPHLRSVVKTILGASEGFEVVGEAANGLEAIELATELKPDIVLMDVEMPGMDGRAATRIIADRSPETRVIAWTNHEEPPFITEMIAAGAFGYLLKGISPGEFIESLRWASKGQSVLSRDLTSAVMTELGRLYRHAEQRAEELHSSYLSTVQSLAAALETKDDQTGNHAKRVRDYAQIITRNFDPTLLDRESLVFGFLLHDVGKIGIPENILMKPGPLDDGEWMVMRQHPNMGARILESATFLQPHAIEIVIAHHERWDGQGYPNKIAREHIPVGARLFSVADTFDAMTSDRPYRKGMSFDIAFQEIERCAGTQFDPEVVKAFKMSKDEIVARMAIEQSLSTVPLPHNSVKT